MDGYKVLGTFITEWDEGRDICDELLATKESAQRYADRLAELAVALGFDGWLVIFYFTYVEFELASDNISTHRPHLVKLRNRDGTEMNLVNIFGS